MAAMAMTIPAAACNDQFSHFLELGASSAIRPPAATPTPGSRASRTTVDSSGMFRILHRLRRDRRLHSEGGDQGEGDADGQGDVREVDDRPPAQVEEVHDAATDDPVGDVGRADAHEEAGADWSADVASPGTDSDRCQDHNGTNRATKQRHYPA